MVTCIKENGKTIKPKDSECLSKPDVLNTRGNGMMINNQEKELKLG